MQETAKFVLLMDRFFDCLNTRNRFEANHTRKPDILPYTQINDTRFDFLEGEFLQYLENWRDSVKNRQGPYSPADRQKMFLSHQTYKGLVMTIRAFIEVTRYLLTHGVDFVLSNKLCRAMPGNGPYCGKPKLVPVWPPRQPDPPSTSAGFDSHSKGKCQRGEAGAACSHYQHKST